VSDPRLGGYLSRPLSPPDPAVLAAVQRGPIDPRDALRLTDVDRLLDPAPLAAETGWCTLPDGVGYVAVRTAMPGVSAEMVDWWFDWHPRDPDRYRVWHPLAHRDNSLDQPRAAPGRDAARKAHWGAVHHPVEDVGLGVVHARIAFARPSRLGFSGDALDDRRVGTIVCGFAGDDRRRVRHTPMIHVFLAAPDGLTLRSRFWLGAALRPYLPEPLAGFGEWALNRPAIRHRALPAGTPRALARHCAEEFANLAALLPELHARFAPAQPTDAPAG
jgi:phloretin hydrolase